MKIIPVKIKVLQLYIEKTYHKEIWRRNLNSRHYKEFMYHVMTLPSFNKFCMFELKIYFLKTVDRSVGSMKGRAVTRTGRYVSCIVRQ